MTQLQYTQTQYSVSDIAITFVVVVVLVYCLCTLAEWLTHGHESLLGILRRQWRYVRGIKVIDDATIATIRDWLRWLR